MLMLLMSIPAVLPRSFSFCKNECNARGTCQVRAQSARHFLWIPQPRPELLLVSFSCLLSLLLQPVFIIYILLLLLLLYV